MQGKIHYFSTAKDTQEWGPSKTVQEAKVVARIHWAQHSRPPLATPGSHHHDSQSHHQTLQCDQEWAHDPYSPVEEKASEPFLKLIDKQVPVIFKLHIFFSGNEISAVLCWMEVLDGSWPWPWPPQQPWTVLNLCNIEMSAVVTNCKTYH